MKILLKNISENAMEYNGEIVCSNILNNGDDIKFLDNIKFSGTLKKGTDFVEIAGAVTAKFVTNCHVCGDMTKSSISFDIFEIYRRDPVDDEYKLAGDEVDFDDMILENVRLNLPVKILCKDECKGSCPICGKNLNREKCDCIVDNKKDARFDVLNKLLD